MDDSKLQLCLCRLQPGGPCPLEAPHRHVLMHLMIVWLWAVHATDYYGGNELLLPSHWTDRGSTGPTMLDPNSEQLQGDGSGKELEDGELQGVFGKCTWCFYLGPL